MEAVGNERKGKWSRPGGGGGDGVWGVEPQQTLLRQSAGSPEAGAGRSKGPCCTAGYAAVPDVQLFSPDGVEQCAGKLHI